jgi:nicotinamide mononucleotide (NMN) deamidase PncC
MKQLVRSIHSSGRQVVLAITGGGSASIGRLLREPGGSQSLLEAVVPYGSAALSEWLGGQPDQYCSEPTARSMAMAAWSRARRLAPQQDPRNLVGLGATASLASKHPKRGEHRIHVAWQTAETTCSFSCTLTKGKRTRRQEERLVARMVLVALAEACSLDTGQSWLKLSQALGLSEEINRRSQPAKPAWTRLLLGQESFAIEGSDPVHRQPWPAVFPGAFNPVHKGHLRMAELAAERLGQPVALELSLTNVDKPPLDFWEINQRLNSLEQTGQQYTVLLTAAPTFREKCRLFPGCTFVVGIDTLVRIGDPRYYGGSRGERDDAIRDIAAAGCRLLVFGRRMADSFVTLAESELPVELRALCSEVPAADFREDVSSSDLRRSEA